MINSENLTIKKFIKNIKKNIAPLLIFLFMIISTTYVYNSLISKNKYTSDMKVLINMNNKKRSKFTQSEDLKTNIQLMNTYSEVITSNQMMKKINKDLMLSQSELKDIESNLNVTSDNNSLILKVTYIDKNKYKVTKVMTSLSKNIQNELTRLFPNIDVSNLEKPTKPVKESGLIKYVLDIVAWLSISFSYLILTTLRDQKIDSKDDLDTLGIDYLGNVKNRLIKRW